MFNSLPLTEKIIERFFMYVDQPNENGCRMFMGTPSNSYGSFGVTTNIQVSAHRVAYCIYHGSIPAGTVIMHKCNNKGCVAEEHLVAGTQRENHLQSLEDGLFVSPFGEQHWNAKMNEEIVRQVRALALEGYNSVQIGSYIGFSRQTVQDVIAGRTWKHVI